MSAAVKSAIACSVIVLAAAAPVAQQNRGAAARTQGTAGAPIEIVPVRDNIYVLAGAGANVVVSAGRDGVFVVDTGTEAQATPLLAAIAELQRRLDFRRPPPERWAAEGNSSTLLEPYNR